MGFDVYGKNPVLVEGSEEPKFPENYGKLSHEEQSAHWKKVNEYQSQNPGTYFRASVWSWRPLWDIMSKTCEHLLSPEMLNDMCVNDGAGPDDQDTCSAMADCIKEFLEESDWLKAKEYTLGSDLRVSKSGIFLKPEELEDEKVWQESRSAYGIEISHILEWCRFLKQCGGFQVC